MNAIRVRTELQHLRETLDTYGYWAFCGQEHTIRQLLQGHPEEVFRTLWHRSKGLDHDRKALLLLLLFGQYVPKSSIESIISAASCTALTDLGLMEEDGASFRLHALALISLNGAYIFVPQMFFPSRSPSLYAGADSLRLCETLRALRNKGSVFEVGVGTGIVGLIGVHGPYIGSEIDPWSGVIAWTNFALNGELERCQIHQGDTFAGCPNPAPELLVSNPPYLPVPRGLVLPKFAGGGPDGLHTATRILDGMPEYLQPTGTLVMVLRTFGGSDGTVLERVVEAFAKFRPVLIHYLSRRRVRGADFRALAEGCGETLVGHHADVFESHYKSCGFTHQFDATVIIGPIGKPGVTILHNYDSWEEGSIPTRATSKSTSTLPIDSSGDLQREVLRLADGRYTIEILAEMMSQGMHDKNFLIPGLIEACRKLEYAGFLKPSGTLPKASVRI